MNTLKTFGPWLVAALALFSAIWSWYHPKTISVAGKTEYQNVTKVIKVPVEIKCPGGIVQSTGDVFRVPEQNAPVGQIEAVLAEGSTKGSTAGFELKSTLSATTGMVSIWAKEKPRPLFGFEDSKEIGIRYNMLQAGVFARWTFVRVGSFYGALYAEGSTDRHTFSGFEVSYRF